MGEGTDRIARQINMLELKLTRKPSIAAAVALTLRYWLAYRTSESNPRDYLHKATHTAVIALRKNESDIRLYMLNIFISIEAGRFDSANEMLDAAMSYRSFLKTNEPLYYAVLYFLYTLLEIEQKRVRSAKKHLKSLEDFIKNSSPKPEYNLMLGKIDLALDGYNAAFRHLQSAYASGCRSVFLYQALYDYYCFAENATPGPVLLPVIHWAAAHEADAEGILHAHQEDLRAAIETNPAMGELVYQYRHCRSPFLLKELCVNRMLAQDYSPEAYAYYKDAERKQIYIGGLYQVLIKAAYVNGAEKINHYTMKEFLRVADMDAELRIFVYHLLITDRALSDLLPERKNEILQFCTYLLENDLIGQGFNKRWVNSLYYYFWTQCNEMRITGKNVDKAEAFLYEDLTHFEITAPYPVKWVYINEPERKKMEIYELTPQPNNPLSSPPSTLPGGLPESQAAEQPGIVSSTIITAAGPDFKATCLSTGRKNILDEKLTVRRMVSRAEPALYRHFFRKGAREFPLLAYLANDYLFKLNAAVETNDLTEMPFDPEEAIPVFETLLDSKETAKPYRMRVLVALGSLYYRTGRFDKALEYYGSADENDLDDAYVEQILNVFLQTHEWGRAAGLIMRKGRFVSNKALFNAVRQLSGPDYNAYHPHLADAAYYLLMQSWFDHDLLSIVLAHYNGSQSEWQLLSRALASLNVAEPRLDEIILKNSIWMHQFDEDAQKAFARMAGTDFSHPLVKQFIAYCTYEMLINDAKPEYSTLNLLENACLSDMPSYLLLALGLCQVYLRNHLTTFHSEEILDIAVKCQEEAGILLPVFREYRDKRPSNPYIEKNQPFIYRSLPEKNVCLYYRIDDEPSFRSQHMRYIKFGLYMTNLALFYHEKITYYFSEEMPTGSITTREKTLTNEVVYLDEKQSDAFFTINNALIYEQMFKYDQVEKIITGLVKDVKQVRSGLM